MRPTKARRPIVHCVVTLEKGEVVNQADRDDLARRVEELLYADERLELLYGQAVGYNVVVEVEHQ